MKYKLHFQRELYKSTVVDVDDLTEAEDQADLWIADQMEPNEWTCTWIEEVNE